MTDSEIRLTQYSHGAGCGCKIAPAVLDEILAQSPVGAAFAGLLVGHESKDDAAVFDLGDGTGVISTTDFFMPIVDDPVDFGRIAATNAISDVYAMGGRPMMAIAILGWPINKLPAAVAGQVVEGGRQACRAAGIPLAGGHSIDSPEPIFGLAVTGRVKLEYLRRNNTAQAGNLLYLTKPLGVGLLTTMVKQGKLPQSEIQTAVDLMTTLNKAGAVFAELDGVTAMTDVTGFGLGGHLLEVCQGAGLSATVHFGQLPIIDQVRPLLQRENAPGGTQRNFNSYGHNLRLQTEEQRLVVCDPQTSGGLLVAVRPEAQEEFEALGRTEGLNLMPFGLIRNGAGSYIEVLET